MNTFGLTELLSGHLYPVLLVFIRISTAFLMMPGFGEPSIPTRIRILTALAIAGVLAPVISIDHLPKNPETVSIVLSVITEAAVGAFIGAIARTAVAAAQVGGQIIGQSIGVSNVFAMGVGMDQSAVIGAAITVGLLAAMFAIDGHHLLIQALADSYVTLPIGQIPDLEPGLKTIVASGATTLKAGMQIAMPFLLLSTVYNAALAGINRAMPSMPVFMVGAPLITIIGIYLLAITIPAIIDQTLQLLDASLASLLVSKPRQ